jgi:hypothetical protein
MVDRLIDRAKRVSHMSVIALTPGFVGNQAMLRAHHRTLRAGETFTAVPTF